MEIQVNRVVLYYEKTGSGKPLLLIHGNGGNSHIFDVLAESLKNKFTIYQIDSRNHGKSSMTESFHYMDMALDIVCFIRALHLEDVSLFGFSDGGIIGLMMASFYPSSISKLVIAGANIYPKGLKKRDLDSMQSEFEKTKNRYLGMMINEPHFSDYDLNRIKIPTLVLAGEHDVIRRNHTMKIHRQIQGSEVMIFKGMTHENYIENTTFLREIISLFCQ